MLKILIPISNHNLKYQSAIPIPNLNPPSQFPFRNPKSKSLIPILKLISQYPIKIPNLNPQSLMQIQLPKTTLKAKFFLKMTQ